MKDMEQKVTKEAATTHYNTLVVAVGNGAANIVDDTLKLQECESVGCIFVDTQSSTLMSHGRSSDRHVLLSRTEDNSETVASLLQEHYKAIVLVCGLGGETGAICLESIAKQARFKAEKVVGIFTHPMAYEGAKHAEKTQTTREKVLPFCDMVVTQDNDKLPKVGLNEMNKAISFLLKELLVADTSYGDAPVIELSPVHRLAVRLLIAYAAPEIRAFEDAQSIKIEARKDGNLTEVTDVLFGIGKTDVTQEGIKDVMGTLWSEHRAGNSQSQCSIYEVNLPPIYKE
jgi:hypothetical protein